MGRSSFPAFLLLSFLLVLSFSGGLGRKLMLSPADQEDPTVFMKENEGLSREMIELDYVEAGPNTNTKSGIVPTPPPPPPASSPSAD